MIFRKDLPKRLHGCDIRLQSAPCVIVQFLFSQEHGYYEETHRVHFDQKCVDISFIQMCIPHYGCLLYWISLNLLNWRTPEKYLLCMSEESCWQTCLFNSIWKINKRSQLFDMCRKFCWSSSIVFEYLQKAEKERVQREQISSMFVRKLEERCTEYIYLRDKPV